MLNSFKAYFNFSKKELNGILVLCILIGLVLMVPTVHSWLYQPEEPDMSEFDKEIAKFYASAKDAPAYSYKNVRDEIEEKEFLPVYFHFDPNGLPVESWKRLGLTIRQIRVIKNYESKGGKFFKKEDLRKIYSVSGKDYARLEPYIQITRKSSDAVFKDKMNSKVHVSRVSVPVMIEINSADSAQLELLRGIGPAFASRIIRYRNRLGGFYAKEQLREVYGIDSLKYAGLKDQVKADASSVQKININTAGFSDMKRHPYLSYKQMNAIIQYRNQHGKYKSFSDLQHLAILNEEILRKIEPYIAF